ncbi:MAG TPA: hypothetical protein VJ911_03375 [Cryomorphaceae bacterium]|nr:hypothetical protein [Cryomorphaceae bacterium]
MKLILTFSLMLLAMCLFAQSANDIIYLKDGSIYKGSITEYLPNENTTIKLLDGRIIVLKTQNISHMTIGKDVVVKKNFDIKQKGYFHNSFLGPQWGQTENSGTTISFSYNMVNGYRVGNHHMGLGLGMENHAGNWYVPIYADYSYHILKGHFSPIIGVNGGLMPPLRRDTEGRYGYSEGAFLGGRIGFVAYRNPKVAFLVNLTYRHIYLDGAEYTRFSFWSESHDVIGSARLNRLGVMIGVVFN